MGDLARRYLEQKAIPSSPRPSSAPSPPSRASGGGGFGGFLENVVGDLKDIGQGLGTLGLTAVKDIAGESAERLTGGYYEHDATLDDLAKAMPGAIKEDYARRYGSWEGFKTGAYEDPLALLGDLLTVATAGGFGAAKGAQAASKAGNVADDLARIAATGADDVGRTAKIVNKVLPGAKDRALIEQMGHTSKAPLGGTRTVLDPAHGAKAMTTPRRFNPTNRFLEEQVWERAARTPVSTIRKQADDLESLINQGLGDDVARADLATLRNTVDQADQLSLSRAYQPAAVDSLQPGFRKSISNLAAKRVANKLIGGTTGRHVQARDRFTQAIQEKLTDLQPDEVKSLHVRMQLDTPESAGRISFDNIENAIVNPQTQKSRELSDLLSQDIARVRTLAESGAAPEVVEKAKRYVEGLTEGLVSEGAPTNRLSNAVDDINIVRHRDLTSAFVDEVGPEAYSIAFDRAYLPLRRALDKRVKGTLPKKRSPWHNFIDDVYEKLGSPDEVPDAIQIDDAMQALGRKQPGYFPQMFPFGNKSDFLMKIGGQTRGIRKRSYPARYKRSEGVLLDDFLRGQRKAYVDDPGEAFTRAGSQIIRHKEAEQFVEDFVEALGRPLESWDQLSSGERAINIDGVRLMLRKRSEVLQNAEDFISSGQEIDKAVVNSVKTSLADVGDETARALQEGKVFAVPKIAAKQLEGIARQNWGGTATRLFHDGPLNMWRQTTLYFRPAYYVNNAFGNTVFVKLQGGSFLGQIRQLSKGYRKRVEKALSEMPEEVQRGIGTGWHSDLQQRSTHLGPAAETRIGKTAQTVKESLPGRGVGKVRDFLQDFNSGIENAARRESALSAVEKQMAEAGMKTFGRSFWRSKKQLDRIAEHGADPQVAKKTLDVVNRTMNDYTALGPVERNIVKRFVAPFYPFYKHATKTLISMPFEHPAKARVLDLINQAGEEIYDVGSRPEWLEGFLPVGEGEAPGSTRLLSPKGANPFEGIFENPLGSLSPFLQTALEQTTGRNPFTQREFQHGDVYSDPFTGQKFRSDPETGVPEPLERGLGGIRSEVAPTLPQTLAKNVAPLEFVRNLLSEGSRSPATGETIRDEFGQPKYPTDQMQQLLRYFGVSTSDYDLLKFQEQQTESQMRALDRLLLRP